MCMVSNIGDQWKDQFPDKWPHFPLQGGPGGGSLPLHPYTPSYPAGVSKEEFDALKQEMEELKKLLKAAKEFDDKTGQPHCEVEAKVKLIKEIAKLVGVDMKDVLE